MRLTGILVLLLALAAGAAQARPDSLYDMGPVGYFTPEAGDKADLISFSNGYTIDTRIGEPQLPAELRLADPGSAPCYCLVQFTGPIREDWLRRFHSLGVKPVGYLPSYTVLAKLDRSTRAAVSGLGMVRWVGLFQPAYKVETGLLDTAGPLKIVCLLMPGEEPGPVTALVGEHGGKVDAVRTSSFGTTVAMTLDAADIPAMARLQEVFWIQLRREVTTCNVDAQWVSQTGWRASAPAPDDTVSRHVWKRGVRGQRVIMSITDTGINLGHDMFRDPSMSVTPPGIWPNHRKVVAFKLCQGSGGTSDPGESPFHGSHVNGTVAGDDSVTGGSSTYDGMSIKGRLYFVDLTDANGNFVIDDDLTPLWDTVYQGRGLPDSLKPRQHSGSWRAANYVGDYTIMEASTDAYCWAHKDFLDIMAAGNEGSGAHTIGNPSLAKDIITVGATGNGTTSNTIAGFSSRGPSQDNRIKPTICAPGVNLWSSYYTGTNTYVQASGTSMATPTVNGATGLIRCYLQDGYYPTGTPQAGDRMSYISSALMRSLVIASADPNVGSYVVPSFDIGWGRIDIDSVLYFAGDSRRLVIRDDTAGVATGEYKRFQFTVSSAMPLRVALAWTDTAAAPAANPTLVNDLNLELTAPSGTFYRGNQYSGGVSQANPGSWDNLNPEECARINAPETGVWTLRVLGNQVRTAARQPFAVTITGDVNPHNPDVGVTAITVPTGTIDSNQSVTPACSVYNRGNTTASYTVRMRIGAGYNNTASVSGHAPNTGLLVTFPAASVWPRGNLAVACSTELANDTAPGNDKATGTVTVRVHDVGATRITAPGDTIDSTQNVTPACSVYNYGTVAENYTVRLRIGAAYNNTASVSSQTPGTGRYVTFPAAAGWPRGSQAVTCSTELATDIAPANNRRTGTTFVRVRDAEASAILAPVGADSGATVAPQARVTNKGTESATFDVTFGIGAYNNTQTVTGLAPGANTLVNFLPWTASQRGSFATACTTRLAGDMVPTNNFAGGTVNVAVHDIAALNVVAPAGTVLPGAPVTPQATCRSYGTQREVCRVFFHINCTPPYAESLVLASGLPAADTTLSFAGWTALVGGYTARCSTSMTTDQIAANNVTSSTFLVGTPGWTEKRSLPAGAKAIKDGGWLAYDAGTARIYATRGQKQPDFFAYSPAGDSWKALAPWLPGTEAKLPQKGSAGCADGSGSVFATKGNSTSGFYKYNAGANAWSQKKDVPLGASNKKVKGGTDIAWAYRGAVGSPYLLKGYKNEFYKYNVAGDSWTTLPPAPVGASQKWDKGSWLAYDDVNKKIYAFKAKYMEFYRYSPDGDSWSGTLAPMPTNGSAGSKKAKEGSAGTFINGNIYAFKGGNTREFWKYTIATNSWTEKETIPTGAFKKKVKAGADIVAAGQVLYATKGNKSDEFWTYLPSAYLLEPPGRDGVLASSFVVHRSSFTVSPNPLAGGFAVLRYSLPQAGTARLNVYDVTGQAVLSRVLSEDGGASSVILDLRHLSAGLYLVRLTSDDFSATQKLVVPR